MARSVFGLSKKSSGVASSRIFPLSTKNDAVGDFAGEAHFVGNAHHGHAALRQVFHHFEHFADHFGVEGGSGFVKQHHARFHCQPACNRDALLLSARQLPRQGVFFVEQPHGCEKLRGFGFGSGGADAFHFDGGEGDVFQHGEVGIQVEMLEDEADFGADFVEVGFRVGNVYAVHEDFARFDALQLVHGADERGFAAAGGAAHDNDFALADVQIHAVDDVVAAEVFVDVSETEHDSFGVDLVGHFLGLSVCGMGGSGCLPIPARGCCRAVWAFLAAVMQGRKRFRCCLLVFCI